MARGGLVVTLDFELAWGYRHRFRNKANPLAFFQCARDVVPRLLDVLNRHHISATWATVGHLMLVPADCPGGRYPYDLPAPHYSWFPGAWYDGIPSYGEDGWECYYAPDLVEQIVACPTYQELASHTFSHIDVGDKGCSEEVVRAEMSLCQELAKRNWGRTLRSVVFPHNFSGHLNVLEETGYHCYRGVSNEWYWLGQGVNTTFRWKRAKLAVMPLRYLDERLAICPPLKPTRRKGRLWEIAHSMFFPGFTGVSKFISAGDRVRRARVGLQRTAERGKLFSLYSHPENFFSGPDALLEAFDQICGEAAAMRDAGQIDILSMGEVAERLEAGNSGWDC